MCVCVRACVCVLLLAVRRGSVFWHEICASSTSLIGIFRSEVSVDLLSSNNLELIATE